MKNFFLPEEAKKVKPLTFKQAHEILNEMHFGACVFRSGKNRGSKRIWWTTLAGQNMHTPFRKETPWEVIIDFAQKQTPVWDRAWLFKVGDIIEFELLKTRHKGIILERNYLTHYYLVQSPVFKEMGSVSDKRPLTNYDLTFYKKAVKIAELPK
jgi:hypothetical protein